MNYGKKKAAKRQKQITSKSAMQAKRVGVRLFKALLLCIIVVAIAGVAGGGLFVKKIIDNSPDITPDDVKPQGFTTLVYADDGTTEIERFVAAGSNRVYKTIDEIPADLQHAFVAIEDERFYEHNGIDIKGIVRAGVSLISGGSQGASTLTQQLIKNNVFPNFVNEKTFYDKLQRKLQEQFLAVSIEKQMSKDEIMEAYLNTINLGQNCLGVQSAAKRYFNKDVSELTLSESAVIAGITQSPGNLNPITNPQKNQKRRDKVLKNMLKQISARRDKYTIQDIDHLRRVFNTMAETLIHHTLSYCPRAAESQLAQVNPLAEINGMVFLDDIIAWSERLIDICHNLLRQTVDDSNMGPVLKYIEQNYMHNLTLSQISTVAGFSPNYFCNIFKACTGKSVSAYLTDLRIQQAKRLLTTTSKSINLIAEDVGYESSSYFIKIFKDTTGMTPNRFRRMNR
mgnify:CR=1 FL=1